MFMIKNANKIKQLYLTSSIVENLLFVSTKNNINKINFNLKNEIQKLNYSTNINSQLGKKQPIIKPLEKKRHSLLELVKLNDNFNPKIHTAIPFYLNNKKIGIIPENVYTQLEIYNNGKNKINRPFKISKKGVTFEKNIDNFQGRKKAISDLLNYWRENKTFSCLEGWRNELYPVFGYDGKVAFNIERVGIALFGFRAYGVHINGYVEENDKLKMWIAQRSYKKPTFPGMLDNIVAGGIAFPDSPIETAIKECNEEASMNKELSEKVVPGGAVTYMEFADRGISTDSQYVFDLKLSKSYRPKPNDGEVEGFYLMEFEEIIERLKNNEFKKNSGVVIIDFMIRHGILSHRYEKDYLEILSHLHKPIPFPGPNFTNEVISN